MGLRKLLTMPNVFLTIILSCLQVLYYADLTMTILYCHGTWQAPHYAKRFLDNYFVMSTSSLLCRLNHDNSLLSWNLASSSLCQTFS